MTDGNDFVMQYRLGFGVFEITPPPLQTTAEKVLGSHSKYVPTVARK